MKVSVPSRIGIVAGEGELPIVIAKRIVQDKGICYIAIVNDSIDLKPYKNFIHRVFPIGKIGAILEYFKENNIQNIVFAGGVKRTNLKSIQVDPLGSVLLTKILARKILGDNQILTIITKFLEKRGFTIISSDIFLDTNNNVTTNTKPSKEDYCDILIGIKLLETLGPLDVGQSVVVENGYILGIEAAEGTDNLISRCSILRKQSKNSGILIKMMKQTQDTRIDMPTIGPNTINNLNKYKYKGIAIQKNQVIIINRELTKELANKYCIFIHPFSNTNFSNEY